jgi:prefoldin beta subunit
MVKESEQDIRELQLIEQNLSNLLMQKQNFQARLIENENALKEIDRTTKETYKILGTIMVAVDKEELQKEIDEEREIIKLRIKNIEKQENKLKEHAEELQKEVLKNLK